MASANTYDAKLLSQAPEVTKADLQDGYNADLLREPTVRRSSATSPRASAPRVPPPRSNSDHLQQPFHSHDNDLESSAAPLQPKESALYVEPRKPWWRTVKGMAIIGGVIIIIVLVAILGGVLGSRHKSNNEAQSNSVSRPVTSSLPTPSASSSSTPTVSRPLSSSSPTPGSEEGPPGGGPGSTGQGTGATLGPVSGTAPVVINPVSGNSNGGNNGLMGLW